MFDTVDTAFSCEKDIQRFYFVVQPWFHSYGEQLQSLYATFQGERLYQTKKANAF